MVGKKRKPHKAAAGSGKERHKRIGKTRHVPNVPLPQGLEARLPRPKTSGKHHSYFEFVENADKKKKLDYQVTNDQNPPPGFAFIPIGNPQLTTACKELSREKGAMIFIVSTTAIKDPNQISHHIHRTGHHIREPIVEEAKSTLSYLPQAAATISNGRPEPLPESQDEYTKQVNGVIRDLFPRIPHTDRQAIIVHAFNLSMRHHDPKPVGLCEDLPLSRRVQLAVLAHIRHTHTRYDQLLRETRWENARKVVEKLCLDIIVRWRGDEETGRDQLDEILREVVVISDSEDSDLDDSDQDPTGSSSDGYQEVLQPQVTTPRDLAGLPALLDHPGLQPPQSTEYTLEGENDARILHERIANRNEQRGFKRYRAWEMALQRNRGELEISDANGQGNVRTVQDARASVIPEEAGPTTVFVGSVPNSNGFVPPQTPWSQPVLPHTGSHPGPPSTAPQNGQVMSVDDSRASWTSVVRQVSPSTHRLEDMLVRSIEPASPENQSHSSFMRPQQNLAELSSPIHYGMQHRPAQAGHDLRAWNISIPVERPFMSERAYQEVLSPGSRRVSYGMDHNPGHGYISQYNDPANSRLRSPVALTQPQMTGIPNVSNRTVIVNASRPGERSNPIFMEDRGGFFERVQTPSNGMRHHSIAAPERPSKWPNHPPHRTSGAPRGGTWDENSRVVGRGRDDPDIEMNPAPPVAGFSAESGFNMPRPRYSSPTQPQRPHDVSGYGQLRQVNPTPTYGATAYRPATDMHIGHRSPEALPHYRQPVYRHYQDDPNMMEGQSYRQGLGSPRRRESVIVID